MFINYKGKLEIDETQIKLPAIKRLLDKVKGTEGTKLVLYLFLVYDRGDENPMRDLSVSERVKDGAVVVYGEQINIMDKYTTYASLIQDVIKGYKDTTDKAQLELDLYDSKIFQFIDLLEDPKNEPKIIKNTHEGSGKISYSTNIDILTKILDNVIKIIMDKASIQGMKAGGKFLKSLRGGLSPNTKGKTTTIKD